MGPPHSRGRGSDIREVLRGTEKTVEGLRGGGSGFASAVGVRPLRCPLPQRDLLSHIIREIPAALPGENLADRSPHLAALVHGDEPPDGLDNILAACVASGDQPLFREPKRRGARPIHRHMPPLDLPAEHAEALLALLAPALEALDLRPEAPDLGGRALEGLHGRLKEPHLVHGPPQGSRCLRPSRPQVLNVPGSKHA